MFDLSLDGKLHLAPIILPISRQPTPFTVLDIGTGSGIWARQFGIEYPRANVIGVDLKLPEPSAPLPKNVSFEVGDLEEPWRWYRELDFIHGRMLLACFRDPRVVFRYAFSAIKAGGYFEMQDMAQPFTSDLVAMEGTAFHEWQMALQESSAKIGRPMGAFTAKYEQFMKDVGFENVRQEVKQWPISAWVTGEGEEAERMREIGRLMKTNTLDVFDGFSGTLFHRVLGWSNERIQDLKERMRKNLEDPEFKVYVNV